MQFCGNWIDTTDYMGLHEDLWHIYKCLREAYVLPESLTESINSSWDLKAHIGLQHLHTNRKIRNEGIEVLGIAVSDTTASQAIADAFSKLLSAPTTQQNYAPSKYLEASQYPSPNYQPTLTSENHSSKASPTQQQNSTIILGSQAASKSTPYYSATVTTTSKRHAPYPISMASS